MTQLVVWTRNLHTTMGQHVALVGEHPVLHQWKPTEPSSWWVLPAGTSFLLLPCSSPPHLSLVVGSHRMECLGDGVWVIRVSLPPGAWSPLFHNSCTCCPHVWPPTDSVQEFKLAVATNSNVVAWQDGPNRLLEVPKQAAEVHVAWEVCQPTATSTLFNS